MKIVCDKRDIANALKTVLKAVPNRATIPILECVLIETQKNVIKVTGNDMEIVINTVMHGQVLEDGAIAVEGKLFNDIISKLGNGDVTIETDNNTFAVTIKAGRSKFNLPGRNAEDYVKMPALDKGFTFSVPQPLLRDLVEKTIFCAAVADNNPMMMGECLTVEGDKLTAVALDGHRIAMKSIILDRNYGDCTFIAPAKSLQEISKLMTGSIQDIVNITVAPANVVFQFDETIILVRTIGGDYFKFNQIFDAEPRLSIKAYVRDLLDSISRTSVMAREGDKKPMIINISGDIANLSVNSNYGHVEEELEIVHEGEDITIGINPRLLMDAVNAFDDDEVEIRFVNPKAPVFLMKEGIDSKYVVLPVNIN